jgi:hypothetical protein
MRLLDVCTLPYYCQNSSIESWPGRMKKRFFSEIELLLACGKTDSRSIVPGFAIMALYCILVETLQAFYEGHIMVPPEGPCSYPDGNCLKTPPAVETIEKCSFPDSSCVRTPPTARSFAHFLRDSPHFADFNGNNGSIDG